MISYDQHEIRSVFFNAWDHHKSNKPLSNLEKKIVDVIIDHPEYHHYFENHDRYVDYQFEFDSKESNPFFHIGLHITVDEQLKTNQPPSVRDAYWQIVKKTLNEHEAQHQLMSALVSAMSEVKSLRSPDGLNTLYVEKLKDLMVGSYGSL